MHNPGRSGAGRRVSSLGRQSEAPLLPGGRETGRRAGAHGRPTDRRELLGSPDHRARSSGERPLVSVVVPAFNEAAGIQATIRILSATLEACDCEPEIVVVDDGSRDATFERAAELSDIGLPVRVLRLSRNFGKEGALLAGLEAASGAAVITIDADLQHPPSLIPDMLAQWRMGARIVHGVKRNRGDEPWLSAARARLVNALVSRLGGIDIRNASDFKLLDRAALEVLTRRLPESRRFYRGLTNWIGFPQAVLEFDVAPRTTGASAWRIRSLVALTLTALVSFTSAPLRLVSVLGVLTLLLALGVGVDAIWSWLKGDAVSGFATIILTLLLIGSFIMISLGIIGEYIAKIYDEIKGRPAYILDRVHGVDTVHGLEQVRQDAKSPYGDATTIAPAVD